jgi:hypothetical protein
MRWPILTAKEKQVVGFVLFCLVLGLASKSYRASHPASPRPGNHRGSGQTLISR